MKEIWMPVKDYEGFYEVSNHGRVKSITRVVEMNLLAKRYKIKYKPQATYQGRVLKLYLNQRGYIRAGLYKNSKMKNVQVHRLVAEAFIPNPEEKPCVNHIDCNPGNNHVSNLEWATAQENSIHAHNNGLTPEPWNKGQAIRLKVNCGECSKELLRTPSRVKRTKTGKSFCNKQCQLTFIQREFQIERTKESLRRERNEAGQWI